MFMISFIILFIFFLPLFVCFFLLIFNIYMVQYLRIISLLCSMLLLILGCILFILLPNSNLYQYLYILEFSFIQTNTFIVFCIDYISLYFILLSIFILYICLLSCWFNTLYCYNWIFYSLFFLQEFLLQFVFMCFDILLFFFFFEGLLITLFLLIAIFGTRRRKIRAVFLLILYTIFGSVLILVSLCYLFLSIGSSCFLYLYLIEFSFEIQKFIWISFFLTFAIKVPMIPFHIWLPEAHVEAPTVGSVFLAGILLKVGTYGFLRFVLCLFPQASFYFYPLICTLGVLGLIYSSFCAVCQLDVKRIVAYSSISHMNLIMLGLFSFDLLGLEGCVLQMLNHGVVSGGLFICIGMLYDRYHTRLVKYMGGLVDVMPIFTFFFLILILSNIAIPGTCSFIGEFLIFLSLFGSNGLIALTGLSCMVLSGIYSLWLFNRVCFGNINNRFIIKFTDVTFLEFSIFFLFAFFILYTGISFLFVDSGIYSNLSSLLVGVSLYIC